MNLRFVVFSAEPDHMGYKSKQLIFRCLNSKKEVVELYLGFLHNVRILQQVRTLNVFFLLENSIENMFSRKTRSHF